MDNPSDHEMRSQQVADATRRYLVGVNTGGIALLTILAGNLANKEVNPGWIVGPVSAFTLGVVFVGVSLFLAKHRAIKRSIAAEKNQPIPSFKGLLWRSISWDIASGITFILAVLCTLCKVANISF